MSAWKRMMLALGLVDEYEEDEQAPRPRPPGNGPAPGGPPRPRQRPPSRPPGAPRPGSGAPPSPPGGVRPVPPGGPPSGGPRPGQRSGVVVRPGVRESSARAQVIEAREINDAKRIADLVRERIPVVVDLKKAEPDMARRVVDFASGLTYALDGTVTKVAKGVVLVSPPRVELSPREVSRLHALGLHDSPAG